MVRNGFDDNRPLWAVELNALQSAPGSFGVVDGCTPTEGTGTWDVDVAPGTVRVDGTGDVSVSGQTVDLADPTGGMNAGETRVVLVTVDATGTASDTAGAAATNPASPDIPANEVLVAVVVVAAADASISDSDLYDPRVVINDGAGSGLNADFLRGDTPNDLRPPLRAATQQTNASDGNATVETLDVSNAIMGDIYLRASAVFTSGTTPDVDTIVTVTYNDATTEEIRVQQGNDGTTEQTFSMVDWDGVLDGKLVDTVELEHENAQNDAASIANEWKVVVLENYA